MSKNKGLENMKPNYSKLWITLIERGIKKKELRQGANISAATFTRLNKDEFVSMETMLKICDYLGCDIGVILSFKD